MNIQDIPANVLKAVRNGMVIPAHPLALTAARTLSERHQRALTRYYLAAGAGGVAVGVHTTQFEIRDPRVGLFEPVLRLAAETMDAEATRRGNPVFKVAGVCGPTAQAVREAEFACGTGYHACLLSLAALRSATVPELVAHCRAVAAVMPVVGFYLQPAAGGRLLPYAFWRQFAELDNVLAIKMAPFNRYQTLDVVRAVCEAGRERDIVLYTGNDDNIVGDLLTTYRIQTPTGVRQARIVGGLLGHWSVWTQSAVRLLGECRCVVDAGAGVSGDLLSKAVEVTDCNAAFFDAANGFHGCIAGIHEVLRRQGLLPGTWCLNPNETLSPGQAEEIDRVYRAYPHLHDDSFVAEHLAEWLAT
jgi:dihydrodipicolinate synthase/N-acetylneuraminate lyase